MSQSDRSAVRLLAFMSLFFITTMLWFYFSDLPSPKPFLQAPAESFVARTWIVVIAILPFLLGFATFALGTAVVVLDLPHLLAALQNTRLEGAQVVDTNVQQGHNSAAKIRECNEAIGKLQNLHRSRDAIQKPGELLSHDLKILLGWKEFYACLLSGKRINFAEAKDEVRHRKFIEESEWANEFLSAAKEFTGSADDKKNAAKCIDELVKGAPARFEDNEYVKLTAFSAARHLSEIRAAHMASSRSKPSQRQQSSRTVCYGGFPPQYGTVYD